MQEDSILIARFKSGEQEAFDRLMASHLDRVYAVAWSILLDREEALDASQEVFIRLHAALGKMPEDSNLSAWLYRVCVNHCIDRRRRTKQVEQTISEEELDRLAGPHSLDPACSVEQAELQSVIRAAVKSLPPRQRAAFALRHYDFLSIGEIANVMGCSKGAVKAHLSRAAATLRGRLRVHLEIGI